MRCPSLFWNPLALSARNRAATVVPRPVMNRFLLMVVVTLMVGSQASHIRLHGRDAFGFSCCSPSIGGQNLSLAPVPPYLQWVMPVLKGTGNTLLCSGFNYGKQISTRAKSVNRGNRHRYELIFSVHSCRCSSWFTSHYLGVSANAHSLVEERTYKMFPTIAGEAKIGSCNSFRARTSSASSALITVTTPRSDAT